MFPAFHGDSHGSLKHFKKNNTTPIQKGARQNLAKTLKCGNPHLFMGNVSHWNLIAGIYLGDVFNRNLPGWATSSPLQWRWPPGLVA